VLSFFKEEYWPLLTDVPSQISEELAGEKDAEPEAVKKPTGDLSQSVFICYSRDEKGWVDQLVADLQAQGVQTWRDVDDITHTSRSNQLGWRSAIENALDQCAALIIVLSQGAVASPEVQAEWNHFASYKRPIYPVIARECKVPFFLKIYQIWDLTAGYKAKLTELAEQLQEVTAPTVE
jgi:hypothetical protein